MSQEGLELKKQKTMTSLDDDQIDTKLNNDTTDMAQIDWIEKVPKVLCLQLNRLDFENGQMVKHKHKVSLEKKIFVDRFLLQNAKKSEEISKTVSSLRE